MGVLILCQLGLVNGRRPEAEGEGGRALTTSLFLVTVPRLTLSLYLRYKLFQVVLSIQLLLLFFLSFWVPLTPPSPCPLNANDFPLRLALERLTIPSGLPKP